MSVRHIGGTVYVDPTKVTAIYVSYNYTYVVVEAADGSSREYRVKTHPQDVAKIINRVDG